jgi:Flp pilus assembly protein TadG
MQYFQRFSRDTRGSMSIELLAVVPILVWVLLSTFVYFDLFRTEANVTRASLTVADMFSREQTAVDDDYIAGAQALLRTLTFADTSPSMRVTVYDYDEPTNQYAVVWSRNTGTGAVLADANLQDLRSRGLLPIMADGDASILVETSVDYSAPFSTGLGPFSDIDIENHTFRTFTVIRPRYNDTLCFDTDPADPTNPILC